MTEAFSGAVLAGGRSRRMGRDKAFVEVDGAPMVIRAVDALDAAGAVSTRVSGGDQRRLEDLGLAVDPDAEPHAGPLAALVGALDAAPEEIVFVLACDLPAVSPNAIERVLEGLGGADVAVPTDGERLQWLHGAWRRRALPILRAAYGSGERAIHRAVADLDVRTITGVPPVALADADHPGDLPASPYPAPMAIAEIDVGELATRHLDGVPLLDVRQPQEYAEAHVPGAVLIPLDQLPDRLPEVPPGEVFVICRSGGRSAKAVEFLALQGRVATNVAGGTMGWIQAGHPVDRGAGSA